MEKYKILESKKIGLHKITLLSGEHSRYYVERKFYILNTYEVELFPFRSKERAKNLYNKLLKEHE